MHSSAFFNNWVRILTLRIRLFCFFVFCFFLYFWRDEFSSTREEFLGPMSFGAFAVTMSQESMNCTTPNTDLEDGTFQLGKIFQYSCLEMIRIARSHQCPAKRSNFTIDHILGKQETKNEENCTNSANVRYDWLTYTRYKPPKLQSKWFDKIDFEILRVYT